MPGKKTIVLCSSAAVYEHVNEIAAQLEQMGYKTIVPHTANIMRDSGDYDITKVKTWIKDAKDFDKKRWLAMTHLKEVAQGDAVLIVNDDKPGRPKYIGPNTTMEWGLAYYLGKPIFVLNGVGKDSNYYEEVYGLSTAVLDGDLAKIKL
jgi:nucleoside 2-deoxyribosyltransferase